MPHYWNSKKYTTFRAIKEEYGFTDQGAVDHIEHCLAVGALQAYYQNETSTLLIRYPYAKLPRTPNLQEPDAILMLGKLIIPEEFEGLYSFADDLMFFTEELTPRDLTLNITTTAHTPPQNDISATANTQLPPQPPVEKVKPYQSQDVPSKLRAWHVGVV